MRVKVACCLALLVGLLVSPAMANVIVYFDTGIPAHPDFISVPLGSGPFTIDIVADLDSPIVGWGLDLNITNPAIANRTATAPVIGPLWDPAAAPDGDGLAGLHFPPPGVTGDHTLLATVEFTPLSVGVTNIIASVTPGDLTEGFAIDPTGFASLDFLNAAIEVTPEPASLALLAVLALFRRR